MNRLFCIIGIIFFSIASGNGQLVSGVVGLEGSNVTLPSINVFLNNGEYFTVSNGDGFFTIKGVPSGKHILKAQGIGFKSFAKEIEMKDGENIVIEIRLNEDIIDLPIVEISATSSTGGMLGSMDLPGSGHYISSAELKELNTTNPHDILSKIPGVQIQEEDGFGLRPNIGLRGSGSERSSKITVMEDGILSAPAPYAAPSAYYFPTIARMQAVEVRKGSSQIVHGPYTTGGVINLISTTIPNEFQGRVKISAGSFGARNIHAHMGDNLGGISYGLEVFQYSADGFKIFDHSDEHTGFDKKDYLAKIKWTSSPNASVYQSLQLKVGESIEKSRETYVGLSYNDFLEDPFRRYAGSQEDEMNTKQRQVSLHYLVNPSPNFFVQLTGYNNTFSRNWYKLDKLKNGENEKVSISELLENPPAYDEEFSMLTGRTSFGSEALLVKANNRSYTSRGIQAKLNYYYGDHQLEAGIRFHRDEMDRFQWIDDYIMVDRKMELVNPGIHGTESNRIESASAIASYLNYKTNIDKWTFNLGMRMENISMNRVDYGEEDPERKGIDLSYRENDINVVIPGISVQYQLDDNQQLFVGAHKGFAPPGSSPDTSPESSVNYELGYRLQTSNFYSSLVAYLNDYSNLLGSDLASSGGSGSGDQFNGGEAIARGIELAMNYRKSISETLWIPIQFQYTFTDAYFENSFESDFEPWGNVSVGDKMPYIPAHVWTITSGIKSRRLSTTVNANFTSDMRTIAGNGENAESQVIDDRVLISLNINYALNHHTDLSFGIHNLLDSAYAVASRPAGWRPGAPRNIVIGIEAIF